MVSGMNSMRPLPDHWSLVEEHIHRLTYDGQATREYRSFRKNFSPELALLRTDYRFVARVTLQHSSGSEGLPSEERALALIQIEESDLEGIIRDSPAVHVATADVGWQRDLLLYGRDQDEISKRLTGFCRKHVSFLASASLFGDPSWFEYDTFPRTYSNWGTSMDPAARWKMQMQQRPPRS